MVEIRERFGMQIPDGSNNELTVQEAPAADITPGVSAPHSGDQVAANRGGQELVRGRETQGATLARPRRKGDAHRFSDLRGELNALVAQTLAKSGGRPKDLNWYREARLMSRLDAMVAEIKVKHGDDAYGTLNEFAKALAKLHPNDRTELLQHAARELYGPTASIYEQAPGYFILYNNSDPLAPVTVAVLGEARLSADSLNVESIALPPKLGEHPADQQTVGALAALQHFARAGGKITASSTLPELFEDDRIDFKTPPNPIGYFDGLAIQNNTERPSGEKINLSVMTYNIALLNVHDRVLGGRLDHVSPDQAERIPHLVDFIFDKQGQDVIMLQEVWDQQHVELFTKEALARGYVPLVVPRHDLQAKGFGDGLDPNLYTDGLMVLVKEELVDPNKPISVRGRTYTYQKSLKEYWGTRALSRGDKPGMRRGFEEVRFTHRSGQEMVFVNTHTIAFPDAYVGRNEQARQVGLHVRRLREENPTVPVFVGGDLNAAPYQAHDTWEGDAEAVKARKKGGQDDPNRNGVWFENTISTLLLQAYSGGTDLFVRGAPMVVADGMKAAEDPAALTEQCMAPFSAGNCNTLHFAQYTNEDGTAEEMPGQLDHLIAAGPMHVLTAGMVFGPDAQYVRQGTDGRPESRDLSDHFPMTFQMEIALESDRDN